MPTDKLTRRVLVADDNVDSAETLSLILQLEHHQVEVAHDGVEAIEISGRFQPDVILLDLGMPKIDGLEACRRIRAESWGKNAVIIALTGWGAQADRDRTKQAGFTAHLVKPVDPDALFNLISAL